MNFEIHPSSSPSSSSSHQRNNGNDSDTSTSSSSSSTSFHHEKDIHDGSGRSAHDADHIYQIRTALHFAIGTLCRAEERADSLSFSSILATASDRDEKTAPNTNAASDDDDDIGDAASTAAAATASTAKPPQIMSQEALTALTDLTFHYATTLLANDLVSFCQHAHRKTVKVDDVLLAVRKDRDGIGADLQRFLREKGVSYSDGDERDHRVSKGRIGHHRSNRDRNPSHTHGSDRGSARNDSRSHHSLLAMKHDNGNGGGSDDSSTTSSSNGSVEELIQLTPERRRLHLKEQRKFEQKTTHQQQQSHSPKPTTSASASHSTTETKKSTISATKSNSRANASTVKANKKWKTSKNRRNRRSGSDDDGGSNSSSSSDDVEFQVDWKTTTTTARGKTTASAKRKNKNEKRRLFLDDSSDDDDHKNDNNDDDDNCHKSTAVKNASYGNFTNDNDAKKLGSESKYGNETNKVDSGGEDEVLFIHRSSSDYRRSKHNSNDDTAGKKITSSSRFGNTNISTDTNIATATTTNTVRGKSRNRTIRGRSNTKEACVHDNSDDDVIPRNRKSNDKNTGNNEISVRKAKRTKTASSPTTTGLSKKQGRDANIKARCHSTDGSDLIDTDEDDNINVSNGKKGKKNFDSKRNDGGDSDSIKMNAIVTALKRDNHLSASASASASFPVNKDMVIDLADDEDDEGDY
ncbi:hypothetical protein ACHAXS_008486 [Conticribra weissflogii]